MRYLFLEANDLGMWLQPGCSVHEYWADHGMGLLVTLAKQHGYSMDVRTLKDIHSWAEWRTISKEYDVICMNVRSWRFRWAGKAAQIAKLANPNVKIWTGGFHATVAPQEMEQAQFDVIVRGEAEGTFLELLKAGGSDQRVIDGHVRPYENIDDLPFIDRELWPRFPGAEWPLEGPGGWGPGPKAITMITGRLCPFRCKFCYPAEKNHFRRMRRRSVDSVIAELNWADKKWGPASSVVYHDSEFLIQPQWLEEYLERYPRETPNWPWWASCRSDMILKWPELTEDLIRQANWHILSIGIESGSDKVLKIINKEVTLAQHEAAIEFINQIGDDMETKGQIPPVVFANVMLGIPGEEREDAFATIRLMAKVKRMLPSISLFTPYPGNTLGDDIIAKGLSLDSPKIYDRYPNKAKMKGIDYQFYEDLLNGKYDRELGIPVRLIRDAQGSAGITVAREL